MKLLTVKDSRGRESTTLSFVAVSWLAITVMFMWKGAAADIGGYGMGVAAILAIWLGREFTDKVAAPKSEEPKA